LGRGKARLGERWERREDRKGKKERREGNKWNRSLVISAHMGL